MSRTIRVILVHVIKSICIILCSNYIWENNPIKHKITYRSRFEAVRSFQFRGHTLQAVTKLLIYPTYFTCFLIVSLGVMVKMSYAQVDFKTIPEPIIYQEQEGLLRSNVYEMVEDAEGFLWIGSSHGISRFDGTSFTNFTHYESAQGDEQFNDVLALDFDEGKNRLWVGTNDGLITATIDELKFVSVDVLYPDLDIDLYRILDLFVDNNSLWLATRSNGLIRIDLHEKEAIQLQFEVDTEDGNHELNQIECMKEDVSNSTILWLGTPNGLIKFNKESNEYEVFQADNKYNGLRSAIQRIEVDSSAVYLGTFEAGLVVFDKHSQQFSKSYVPSKYSSQYARVHDLYLDKSKSLLVSLSRGLMEFDTELDSISDFIENDLDKEEVYGVTLQDSRGILWNCAEKVGLLKYDLEPSMFQYIELVKRNRLQRPITIREIVKTEDGYVILGHRSGGFYLLDKTLRDLEFVPISGQHGRNLRDMAPLPNGDLLILTYRDLLIYNPITRSIRLAPYQLDHLNPGLNAVEKESDDIYWIATNLAGMYELDVRNNSLKNYQDEFNILGSGNHKWIQHLFIDPNQNLWMGKGTTTVMSLSDRSVHVLSKYDTTLSQYKVVTDFEADRKGRVWVGGYGKGIGEISFESFDSGVQHRIDGLYNALTSIDDTTMLTIGPNEIGIFNTRSYQYTPLKLSRKNNHLQLHAPVPVLSLDENRYLIGCENGVLLYNRSVSNKTITPPMTYLSSITDNGQIIYQGNGTADAPIDLPQGTKNVIVTIGLLDFSSASQPAYKYKLNDMDWVDLGDNNNINLTNLSQGRHTLMFDVCYSSTECSGQSTLYAINILPYWYETWWSKAGFALLLGLLGFQLIRLRNRRVLLKQQLLSEKQEAERLKELDEFKSRFYDNITHEFRTPLTVIQGMAEEIDTQDNPEEKTKLNLIKKNTQGLLGLINQILDISKLKAGKINLTIQQDNIITYVKYLTEAHESLGATKDITLRFHAEYDEILMDFDPLIIKQILSNLLSNAIKFTPQDGTIDVQTNKKLQDSKFYLQIAVRDNGVGIPAEEIPYVFDRFHRSNLHADQMGTGIGLAFVKELIQCIAGNISVTSKLGRGTEFVVSLPIENSAPISPVLPLDGDEIVVTEELASSNKVDRGLPTLLVIEDNMDVIYYLKAFLKESYRLLIAENGEQGVKIAFETLPDLIISDVMMPKMSGYEVCDVLKRDVRTSHIPIILLTAKAASEDKIEGLLQGADAYIIKPFDKKELLVRLANLHDIRKKLQEKYSRQLISVSSHTETMNKEDDFIIKVQRIVLENLENDQFDIHQLSAELFLSRSQVHRKIKALTGMSTAVYIRHIRLHKGKELLETTNESIAEIAFLVGFKTSTYFSQSFKSSFGVSPTTYRK